MSATLRMYPPVWLVARVALRDDHTGRFPVAAGAGVLISPYVMHRRAPHWHDATVKVDACTRPEFRRVAPIATSRDGGPMQTVESAAIAGLNGAASPLPYAAHSRLTHAA